MAEESRHIKGLKNTVFSLLSIPIICPKTIVNICGTMQKNSGGGLQMWVNVPKALLSIFWKRARLPSRGTIPVSYSKKKLESACERMISLSSAPSIRTITTILKNSRQPSENTDAKSDAEDSCNKYGITRGAAYFRKGGADNE